MQFGNRIKVSGSCGLADVALGVAIPSFADFPVGDTTYIILSDSNEWEVGTGVVAGTTLTRTTVDVNHLGTTAHVDFTGKAIQIAQVISASTLNGILALNEFTDAEKVKLQGIESGAEANNISDVDADDLTNTTDSTLHQHAYDRNMDNAVESNTKKVFTADERDKLTFIESGATRDQVASEVSFTPAAGLTSNQTQAAIEELATGKEPANANIQSHIASVVNPHGVTKAQVDLSNVDNTSDANKPVSTAQQVALDLKEDASAKGLANGYAPLDSGALVPITNLPSYVDDVLEYANLALFPVIGESGKIYVALDTNKTYRWSGSTYIYITSGAVDSVNGKTGVITLNTDEVPEGAVAKYTTDAEKAHLATLVDGTGNPLHYHDSDRDRANHSGTQSTTTVIPASIGAPTHITELQSLLSHMGSASVVDGGGFTDIGDGSCAIADGEVLIRGSASSHVALVGAAFVGDTFIPQDKEISVIYVDYNAGTPILTITTDLASINMQNLVPLWMLAKEGTTLHYLPALDYGTDWAAKAAYRMFWSRKFDRKNGGSVASETGVRNLAVSAGAYFFINDEFSQVGIDTNVSGTFHRYRYIDGAWVSTDDVQLENTEWNDLSVVGSEALSAVANNNKYLAHWVYLIVNNDTTCDIALVTSQAEYDNYAEAESAPLPLITPVSVEGLGVPIALYVIAGSATTGIMLDKQASSIEGGVPTNHNLLAGLDVGDYQHLTAGDATKVETETFNNLKANQYEILGQDASAFIGVGTVVDIAIDIISNHSDGGVQIRKANTSLQKEIVNPDAVELAEAAANPTTRDDGSALQEGDLVPIALSTTGYRKYIDQSHLYVGEHYNVVDAGGVWEDTTRGIREEYPAAAAYLLESSKLWLFDLTTGAPQLWKRRTLTALTATSICGTNGETVIGTTSGVLIDNLIKEGFDLTLDYTTSTSPTIINNTVNEVAITVLPNAPVDLATGAPKETELIGTDGGASFIKDDDAVVDVTGATMVSVDIQPSGRNVMASTSNIYTFNEVPSADTPTASADFTLNTATTPGIISGTIVSVQWGAGGTLWIGTSVGLYRLDYNETAPANSALTFIDAAANSGSMLGDCKSAWVPDADVTSITGAELVANGTFDSTINSWTLHNSPTLVWDGATYASACAILTSNGSLQGAMQQALTLTLGETYVFTAERYSDGDVGAASQMSLRNTTNLGVSYFTNALSDGSGLISRSWLCTDASVTLRISNEDSVGARAYDNINCRLAIPDRTVSGDAIMVHGTVPLSQVATGSELRGFGPFTTSNYLLQPHNDNNVYASTAAFYMKFWFKTITDGTGQHAFDFGENAAGKRRLLYIAATTGELVFYNGTIGTAGTSTVDVGDDAWHQGGLVSHGDDTQTLYIDGEVYATASIAMTSMVVAEAMVGLGFAALNPFDGSIALPMLGAGAPSSGDWKNSYLLEKEMYQANSQITLAGSSDAIVSMDWNEYKQQLSETGVDGMGVFSGIVKVREKIDAAYSGVVSSENIFEVVE